MEEWTLAAPADDAARRRLLDRVWDAGARSLRLPPATAGTLAALEATWDVASGRITGHRVCTPSTRPDTPAQRDCRLRTRAPGMAGGIAFDAPPGFSLDAPSGVALDAPSPPLDAPIQAPEKEGASGAAGAEEIDAIVPEVPRLQVPPQRSATAGWAVVLDPGETPAYYTEHVAKNPAFVFPFELDPFQKQAIAHIERGENVFVAAHTSAGKTAVAEYAVALATRRHMTRAVYTSPIKALSNQKFRDFRRTFGAGPGDVGLLTGDVQINPDAGCLVMTTEVLRSMLYRGAALLADVEFVVFDEVHYVNDAARGVVWEEVIIMLPPAVTLVMLSATTPNTAEFADWVGRTRGRHVYVVSTAHRPVPLQHYLYVDGPVPRSAAHDYAAAMPSFLAEGASKDQLKLPLVLKQSQATGNTKSDLKMDSTGLADTEQLAVHLSSTKLASSGAADAEQKTDQPPSTKLANNGAADAEQKTDQRSSTNLANNGTADAEQKTDQPPSARIDPQEDNQAIDSPPEETPAFQTAPLMMVVDGMRRFCEPGFRCFSATLAERKKASPYAPRSSASAASTFPPLVALLRKRSLLPAVVFAFSRRQCEQNADALAGTDLLGGAREKSAVRVFMERCVRRLADADRGLPQIARVREMLLRGVAVHHSGLLPLLKEAVEVLFARGLVRVLFATETFAMGVNMPARTVVFASLRKHDGTAFRALLPGEYTQMAGRAGRRGLDAVGTVVVIGDDVDEPGLRAVLLGGADRLVSRFRLTYGMVVLGLLRAQHLRIEDMLRRSFAENAAQRVRPDAERALRACEAALAASPEVRCAACAAVPGGGPPDAAGRLAQLHEAARVFARDGAVVHAALAASEVAARTRTLLQPGRILVVRRGASNVPALLLRLSSVRATGATELSVLVLADCTSSPTGSCEDAHADIVPPCFVDVPDVSARCDRAVLDISADRIAYVTEAAVPRMPDMGSTRHYRERDLDAAQDALAAALRDVPRPHDGAYVLPPLGAARLPALRELDLDERRLRRGEALERVPHLLRDADTPTGNADGPIGTSDKPLCPDVREHYCAYARRAAILERIAEISFSLSDDSLALLPEYHARLGVLRALGYVAGTLVLVKGRVACELNTVHELLAAELLFDNAFAACDPAETVALLSAMVFADGTPPDATADRPSSELEEVLAGLAPFPALVQGVSAMRAAARRLEGLQRAAAADSAGGSAERIPLNFGLVRVVHEWARGVPFVELTRLTDTLEGTIVRCIVRLDETCREVRSAAHIMGNTALARKMEDASRLIKRDICFASSLYI